MKVKYLKPHRRYYVDPQDYRKFRYKTDFLVDIEHNNGMPIAVFRDGSRVLAQTIARPEFLERKEATVIVSLNSHDTIRRCVLSYPSVCPERKGMLGVEVLVARTAEEAATVALVLSRAFETVRIDVVDRYDRHQFTVPKTGVVSDAIMKKINELLDLYSKRHQA